MELLQCSGIDALTGLPLELGFQDAIQSVVPSSEPASLYLAPGFIDLQVNGFAGVDYNHPGTPHDEIARSLRAQFATGRRLYPTVITGSPDGIVECLRNLAAALRVPAGRSGDRRLPRRRPPHLARGWPARAPIPASGSVHPISTSSTVGRTPPADASAWRPPSPERPAGPAVFERITAEGVVAAIGHTLGSAAQIAAAALLGATLSTHLGNGAHQLLRRRTPTTSGNNSPKTA